MQDEKFALSHTGPVSFSCCLSRSDTSNLLLVYRRLQYLSMSSNLVLTDCFLTGHLVHGKCWPQHQWVSIVSFLFHSSLFSFARVMLCQRRVLSGSVPKRTFVAPIKSTLIKFCFFILPR